MKYFRNGTRIAIVAASMLCMALTASAETFYVDGANGNDANGGTGWSDAFGSLHKAIQATTGTQENDQIWVKGSPSGITYYPDEGPGITNGDRAAAFELQEDVVIYGGFAGTETDEDQRDAATNITILSGDIDQDGLLDNENSYSVVKAGPGLNQGSILDGFTITAGNNTLNTSDPSAHGGGIRIDGLEPGVQPGTAPRINNCIITGNRSSNRAGGMYIDAGSPIVTACIIENNMAADGAGIAVDEAAISETTNPHFVNCTIHDSIKGLTAAATRTRAVTPEP